MKRPLSESMNSRKKSVPLSELKSAGLLQNKICDNGQSNGMSDISWIASKNSVSNKENENSNCNEIVDHIPKPFPMGKKAAESKKKIEKKYNINTTSINNAVYDENWATKQTNSFTDWMNFTFSSSLESPSLSNDDMSATLNEGNIEGNLNANGLKIFLQKRNEALNRQKCFQLYHSTELTGALKSIEEEVCEGRLLIREDRDILADLGLQEELFSLIFSYEMPWIRLGLEIVFGEIISVNSSSSPKNSSTVYPCKSNCPKWKSAIKTFVLERMLTNVDLVAQYSKQQLLCVSHEKKLKEQLRQHMIKKFLSLVLILDLSKKNSILLLPTLFVRDAPVKSSKEIILSFCRCIMRGEGDVIRHLSLLGYTVSFAQSFIDEFDYTVKNLAVDLRDGVRLARLMELITHSKDLSDQLRVPAGSRLQKLHNVGLVLKKLYEGDVLKFDGNTSMNSVSASCDQVQESKDIVDGNRDRTLFLLWKILYTFELKMLVDSSKVLGEAAIISGTEGWRRSIYGADDVLTLAVRVPVKSADGVITYPQNSKSLIDDNLKGSDTAVLTNSLLKWCHAIAGKYGVPVYNLTSCLADGRALCLLIHYYHPTIITTKMIRNTTVSLHNINDIDELDEFTEASVLSGVVLTKAETKKGLEGERKNFATLRRACHAIGGIPLMLPIYDTSNQPEEKTMTIFLGYLFARMIESSSQIRAVIRIQRFIRKARQDVQGTFQHTVESLSASMREKVTPSKKVTISVMLSSSNAASIINRRVRAFIQQRKYQIMMMDHREKVIRDEADRVEALAMIVAAEAAAAELIRLEHEAEEEAVRVEVMRLEQEATANELIRLENEKTAAEVYRLEQEAIENEVIRQQEVERESEIVRLREQLAVAEAIRQEEEKAANEIIRLEEEREVLRLKLEAEMIAAEYLRLEQEATARQEVMRLEEQAVATELVRQENERVAAEVIRLEQEALAAEVVRLTEEVEAYKVIRMQEKAAAAEVIRIEEERVVNEAIKLEIEAAECIRLEELRNSMEMKRLEEEKEAAEVLRLELEAKMVAAETLRLEQEVIANELVRQEAAAASAEISRLEKEAEAAELLRVEAESAELMRLEEEAKAAELLAEEEAKAAELLAEQEEQEELLRLEQEQEQALETFRLEEEVLEFYRLQAEEEEIAAQNESMRLRIVEAQRLVENERLRVEEVQRCERLRAEELSNLKKAHDNEIRRLGLEALRVQEVHDEKERVRMEHERDLEKVRLDLIWAESETVRLQKEEDAKNAAIACALKEQERVDEELVRIAILNAEREKEETFKAQVEEEKRCHEERLRLAIADGERRFEEAARKYNEDLLIAAEARRMEEEETARRVITLENKREEARLLERARVEEERIAVEKEQELVRVGEREALERARELEREALEQKRVALEIEREQERAVLEQERVALEVKREQERIALELEKEQVRVASELEKEQERDRVRVALEEERVALQMAHEQERMAAEIERELERGREREALEQRYAEENTARLVAEGKLQALEEAKEALALEALRVLEEARSTALAHERAAAIVQASWKTYVARTLQIKTLYQVILIQAYARGFITRKIQQNNYDTAIKIQTFWRKIQHKLMAKKIKKAVFIIQLMWTKYSLKMHICKSMKAVYMIQQWFLIIRKYRLNISNKLLRKNKTILIQKKWRGYCAIKLYKSILISYTKNAIIIQKYARRNKDFKIYNQNIKVIKNIQFLWRLKISNNIKKKKILNDLTLHNIDIMNKNNACRKIVLFLRSIVNNKLCNKAVRSIQKWYRAYTPLMRARKMSKGFRRLQAFCRAYRIRAKNSAIVCEVLKRLQIAEKRAVADPSMRLGKRTQVALQVLQSGKMISQLLKACQTLELSTQLSRYCGEAFAQAGASRILFALIRSCNRSTPHQELLRNALVVLLNVARHDDFASVVAESADAADTLVDLLQMFRDKRGIFGRASELLCRLISASNAVKVTCTSPEYKKRLDGIYNIVERKHRLDDKLKKIQHVSKSENEKTNDKDHFMYVKKYIRMQTLSTLEEPIQYIKHIMYLLGK